MQKYAILLALMLCRVPLLAQYTWQDPAAADTSRLRPLSGLGYRVEAEASVSRGHTPLWLNANKYGLSSLERANGYLRVAAERPLATDSARRWGVGYALDVAAPLRYTSHVVVQQAYAEARWLHGVLTVGSKEWPMELKNGRLSSGSQTLGINARPVPQVRLALPQYWTLPLGGGWLHLKGHIAYGRMTDEGWQHEFTGRQSPWADDVRYHSKAGYLMIGNPERFQPLSLEVGLEMATLFGGTCYRGDGSVGMRGGTGLRDYWHAFVPGGQDATDGEYGNVAGDQLGSWVVRVNYDADTWRLGVYADHFFEDHSAMLHVDYDGYGEGEEYMQHKDRRYYLYGLHDIMLGAELQLKYRRWLRSLVVEYISTRFQSGPYNHDHTANIPDHMAGEDNYYNHGSYLGWQHWGQVIGNPLYRSPLYNEDGRIRVADNRFRAFHLGAEGGVASRVDYRLLATYQEGWGTYADPYTRKHHNVSVMAEAAWRVARGWQVRGAWGMDFGHILGSNAGFQLTITRKGLL